MQPLLVEDHHDTARTISRLLRSAVFTVTTASDVATAAAAADGKPFDVLVERSWSVRRRWNSIGFQEMWIGWRSAGTRWQHIERQGEYQVNR
jgi:hypothetical protein